MSTMTFAHPKPAADFESVQTLAASPEAVLGALTTPEAVTGWWGPTTGATGEGGSFSVSFGDGRRIDLVVESASTRQVVWEVAAAPHTTEWVGTTIVFDLAPTGQGTELRFRHLGLTPQLECFDMCHSGWTHYLASLAAYVDRGAGEPYRED
jgi:uncharacterized protein YndB with AHSA1/START domain